MVPPSVQLRGEVTWLVISPFDLSTRASHLLSFRESAGNPLRNLRGSCATPFPPPNFGNRENHPRRSSSRLRLLRRARRRKPALNLSCSSSRTPRSFSFRNRSASGIGG